MADNINQQITDLLLQHDIDLLRVLDGNETQISQTIRDLTTQLVAILILADPTQPIRREFQRQRLDRVINEMRRVLRREYRSTYRTLRRELVDLGTDEIAAFRDTVNQALTIPIMNRSLNSDQLVDIIDARAITANANDAETLRGFFEREAAAHHRRARAALLEGFSRGDNLAQLTDRLGQLTDLQERETIGIARTAFNHVTTNVRIEMMQRNANLFRGVIAIAVLDGRTTRICISRSNGMWDLNTGRPLPGSPTQIPFPGPTPWHFGERTQLYPLTKTAQQIGRQSSEQTRRALQRLTPEQRSLLNADPPITESYPDWLRRQPESVQVKVLGRTRRELWLQGKLSLRELVTQRGRPLTLKELARRRERAA